MDASGTLQYISNVTYEICMIAVHTSQPRRFYKLLTANMCHRGFTYKKGLNVDTLPFNPSGDCEPGGLYYTDLEHIPLWDCPEWPLVADVTVPDDALVYQEPSGNKWKADKLVLSNIRPLYEFFRDIDEATVCQMLAKNGFLLQYTQYLAQTEAMCLAAVRQNGYALKFVDNQTEAVCRAAVAEEPDARRYVKIPIDF